jgi:hypothetical protein
MISNQSHSNPYVATGANTFHHPDFSYGYNQHLYTWQQLMISVYQHFAQHAGQSAVVSSPAQQEQ